MWFGSIAVLVVVSTSSSHAYESDQLSARAEPPGDATALADAQVDRLLALAIAETNQLTRCEGSDAEVRSVLARQVHAHAGHRVYVAARQGRPPMGFGTYAAWLETGPVDRVQPARDQGLFGHVGLLDSPVLATFGPASTITLDHTLVGTDKIDHFWIQGYDYFRRSHGGADPDRAVDWGTRTERGVWGLGTTGVFSFADLAANFDGLQFYAGLLGADSVLQRDPGGCVAQVRPFSWADWIDWRYDEVQNPSVFRQSIVRELAQAVQQDAAWYCTGDPTPPAVDDAPWVGAKAPSTRDATDLTDLCAPALAAHAR